jgi:6-phosphogluconate dehydrogenase
MQQSDIGIIGLSVMGANIARNFGSHGYHVSVFNRSPEKTRDFMSTADASIFSGFQSLPEFAASLKAPTIIFMMVQAGAPVDDLINQLLPIVQKGTVFIDGGNSYYKDTIRRVEMVEASGCSFVGMGVSGGEQGALHGPSLMPGGSSAAWPIVEPLLRNIAATIPGNTEQCVTWIGTGGSGHFVKMIHNGIEYADMQLISEAYGYMHAYMGMTTTEIA